MAGSAPEHQGRSVFGLFGKKDEHRQQEHGNVVEHHGDLPPSYHQEIVPAVSLHATEDFHSPKHEQGNEGGGGIMTKLHGSDSSSSWSSDEEEEDGKKNGLKKEMKKKLPGGHQSEDQHYHGEEGEKRQGFMDKIKEKLPGHKKEDEEN